jgi:hypothetical protein
MPADEGLLMLVLSVVWHVIDGDLLLRRSFNISMVLQSTRQQEAEVPGYLAAAHMCTPAFFAAGKPAA